MPFQPRYYQADCSAAILKKFETQQRVIAVLATGLGKTVISCLVMEGLSKDGRVLFMAHKTELINQAANAIEFHTGEIPEFEQGPRKAEGYSLLSKTSYLCATTGTLQHFKRLRKFDPFDFSLVVVDETHHYTKGGTYDKILSWFLQNPDIKILGLTATPKRHDGKRLADLYQAVGFQMGLIQGIEEGFLCKPLQTTVVIDGLEFDHINTVAGDFSQGQLSVEMGGGNWDLVDLEKRKKQEAKLHKIVSTSLDVADGRSGLVFGVDCSHAENLCNMFNRYRPGCAGLITQSTSDDERKHLNSLYQSGRLQILCGVRVFLEGYDAPNTELIVNARPTKSLPEYEQCIGRGTRTLKGTLEGLDSREQVEDRLEAIANSAKPHCLVLDFAGNAGRHKIINCADVLGGKASSDDIDHAKKWADELRESGKPVDFLELLDIIAKRKAAEEEEAKKREQRNEELRKQHAAERLRLTATADYRLQEVDLFNQQQSTKLPPVLSGHRGGPTLGQLKMLGCLGVSEATALTYTKQQAGVVIGKMKQRKGGEFILTFGRHAGKPLKKIPDGYLQWAEKNIGRDDVRRNIKAYFETKNQPAKT